MTAITGRSANELFLAAVTKVLAEGRRSAPRGMTTQELIGVTLTLAEPRRRLIGIPPVRILNPAFAAAEAIWILSGSDESWICDYNARMADYADGGVLLGAYGPRVRRWAGSIDQLDQVRATLTGDPDTRRAVVQLYDPARDGKGHKDVPCTLGYRFFLRDGALDMHTTMRSQDLWLGFCYDLFTATVLHELMAAWVGARLGVYRHQVDSLHLYTEHLPLAHSLPAEAEPSPVMPRLAAGWDGFDGLLAAVLASDLTGHQGWDQFGAVMRSYRVWKTGDHPDAREVARQIDGPLGDALSCWYDHLAAQEVPS
jgi:thymidylate synthase